MHRRGLEWFSKRGSPRHRGLVGVIGVPLEECKDHLVELKIPMYKAYSRMNYVFSKPEDVKLFGNTASQKAKTSRHITPCSVPE